MGHYRLLNRLFSRVNENVVYLRVLFQKFFQTAATFASLSGFTKQPCFLYRHGQHRC